MDPERAYSLVPLASRLDRLDIIVKRLEGKYDGSDSKFGRRNSGTPFDLAVRDDYFKGSLLDRINTLEYRLFQLSLEMESSSSSLTSTITSRTAESSSSQGSRRAKLGISSSTFDIIASNKHPTISESQPLISNEPQTQSTQKMSSTKAGRKKDQKTKKPSAPVKDNDGKDKAEREDRASKNKIQQKPRSFPYMKLLGC